MTSTTPTILALARLPGVAAAWFLAAQGGLISYGLVAADDGGLPKLRDLSNGVCALLLGPKLIVGLPAAVEAAVGLPSEARP